jgi:anaerobic selenocysteine-containing dehydrogenase
MTNKADESMSTISGAARRRIAIHTCPLCEASCGLEVHIEKPDDGPEQVALVRGDRDDVFSRGFLCPKGASIGKLHHDPDRLRAPLVRRDGRHVAVSWAEAFAECDRLLSGVIERHGRAATSVYLGNPTAHSLAGALYLRPLIQALGTPHRFSASTVDQFPKQVASAYLFGTAASVAVPDLDRTDLLLLLGANPLESNGSLCTAPDFPGRIEAIRQRGGKVIVVDPRRSRTAQAADQWIAVQPGRDAHLLLAVLHILVAEGLADPGDHVRPHLAGWDQFCTAVAALDVSLLADQAGVDVDVLQQLARDLAAADTAAVYGRIGTTVTEFGTAASWLVDAVNIATGSLDVPGGVMWTMPVAGGATTRPGPPVAFEVGKRRTRVSSLPQVIGEWPVAALAEEISTPGTGQLKALITVAGNPVVSTTDSTRLDAALTELECMISVDIYLNETTRHADVILPPPSALEKSHYDLLLLQFAVRNVANYSPPAIERPHGQPDEWEILAVLAAIAAGLGPDVSPSVIDDQVAGGLARSISASDDGQSALDAVAHRRGPERLLDLLIRSGPNGDQFGAGDGLTLADLEDAPHGIDLGPLESRLPGILRTPSGKIELAHPVLMADLDRVRLAPSAVTAEAGAGESSGPAPLSLVGRRDLRSNNSWMHNISTLVKGAERCVLHMHPDDAGARQIRDGSTVTVSSSVGSVDVPVALTTDIRAGVVSLPHGWGHHHPDARLAVAAKRPGVNSNVLAPSTLIDPLSGTSVLNGINVVVLPR